ncbi:TRAM LAG1 CLN8-like proteiny domain containing protein [Aphelenchoides besseyi]|nr:TRAM LAG1 CLN8-like proteiny domain containing protein [Aphelenchoides besseyi]
MVIFDTTDFWNKDYWLVSIQIRQWPFCRLPRNDTWNDVPTKIPQLWTALYFALPIMLIRLIWEAVIGIKLGHLLGYIHGSPNAAAIDHIFGGFARQTKRKKVLETFWRFTAYAFLFTFGCYVLHDKPWLYNTHHAFIAYPRHQIETDVWLYYMIQMGFYISLLIGSITDVRRSDFWEMFIHHIVTISLLSFSWTVNFVRLGSLILLSHDLSDPFLEGAKLIRYTRRFPGLANVVFVVFLICWTVTRLIYFPFVLVLTGICDGPALIQPDYEVFNLSQKPYAPRVLLFLLLCLMVLHIFWTYLIFKIVIRALRSGEAADVRSDSEESEDIDGETKQKILRKRRLAKKTD